jgi:hypothetical protein
MSTLSGAPHTHQDTSHIEKQISEPASLTLDLVTWQLRNSVSSTLQPAQPLIYTLNSANLDCKPTGSNHFNSIHPNSYHAVASLPRDQSSLPPQKCRLSTASPSPCPGPHSSPNTYSQGPAQTSSNSQGHCFNSANNSKDIRCLVVAKSVLIALHLSRTHRFTQFN